MIINMVSKELLRKIKPLRLREILFWRVFSKFKFHKNIFNDVRLAFAPNVILNLLSFDVSHQQIAMLGFVELEVTRRLSKLVIKGGLLVDVGANWGYYSTIWASAKDKNRVIAFEASPRNIKPFKYNLIKNNLTNQVEVFNFAVGNINGIRPFDQGPSNVQPGWGD